MAEGKHWLSCPHKTLPGQLGLPLARLAAKEGEEIYVLKKMDPPMLTSIHTAALSSMWARHRTVGSPHSGLMQRYDDHSSTGYPA